jgi:hypothetical protein
MSPSASTALLVENHIAPHSHQETLLRTRSDLQASVLVNAPGFDIPPEFWWGQTFVYLAAFWVPTNSNTLQAAAGTSEGYLGSTVLTPRRYPLETNAGEYVVIWNTEEPLVTQTARQSPTATLGPNVLFQAEVDDPGFVFSNSYADVSVNFAVRAFSLWEDPA